MSRVGGTGTRWLSLQQASRLLDAHPATVRQWADRGRIRTYRTPGRHRRFSEEDVRALVAAEPGAASPALDLLLSATVGRARLESDSLAVTSEAWHRDLDEAARERHRALGRDLLRLLVRHLAEPEPAAEAILEEGRSLGREYGRLARIQGLALPDAVRAFLHFRDVLMETTLQTAPGRSSESHAQAQLRRRSAAFLDDVLVAMLGVFTAGEA